LHVDLDDDGDVDDDDGDDDDDRFSLPTVDILFILLSYLFILVRGISCQQT